MEIKSENGIVKEGKHPAPNPQNTTQIKNPKNKIKKPNPECGKLYLRPNQVRMHQVKHTPERNFQCSQCFKAYKSAISLKLHEKIHSDATPFSCKICGKSFKLAKYLKIHRSKHSSERQFECADCGRKFKLKSHLKEHLKRIHLGIKPSAFSSKWYACGQCDQIFYGKHNYEVHSLIHSDFVAFECLQCDKKFKSRYYLKSHLRLHEREQQKGPQFPRKKKLPCCKDCGIYFKCQKTLRLHREMRHGEPEQSIFECKTCTKKFTTIYQLQNHIKCIHGSRKINPKIQRKDLTSECSKEVPQGNNRLLNFDIANKILNFKIGNWQEEQNLKNETNFQNLPIKIEEIKTEIEDLEPQEKMGLNDTEHLGILETTIEFSDTIKTEIDYETVIKVEK
ncbi:zinc finger protein 578-like [Phlebotomus papatasi]|uniref:zinc finger protein 578-like n=1 Tax=Phlebotomus papatasi TaxID=29031 RepID=UPI002483F34A|nr:zinc finger protein 578-like [Phlebotomus papatasi]